MKYKIITIVILVLINILCSCISLKKQIETPEIVDSSTLEQTIVALTLDRKIEKNINVIYSPSFLAAWQEYAEQLPGKEINLAEESEAALQLNAALPDKAGLDTTIFYGLAGLCDQGIKEQIQKQLTKNLVAQEQNTIMSCGEDELVFFGYYHEKIKTQKPFENKHSLEFGEDLIKVRSFGFKSLDLTMQYHKVLHQQLVFNYYKPRKNRLESEYIITIATTAKDYELIAAKVMPKETLGETIDDVLIKKDSSPPIYLGIQSTFLFPAISFNVLHHFTSLEGKTIQGSTNNFVKIGQAIENISFVFDEKGPKFAHLSIPLVAKNKYELLYDTAFLLLLINKKSGKPDFALWIDNSELLERTK